jgi:hypothetical protein
MVFVMVGVLVVLMVGPLLLERLERRVPPPVIPDRPEAEEEPT